MRIDPADEIIYSDRYKRRYQRRVNRITRILAIVLAALSTYALIIKIVFL